MSQETDFKALYEQTKAEFEEFKRIRTFRHLFDHSMIETSLEYESELEHQLSTADEELEYEKQQHSKLQSDYQKSVV